MNEELKEIMEEAQELAHKSQKLYQKAQKMGQRSGGYSRGGGYQRMGQNEGNWNSNQSMGQSGGVFWGQQPMNPMGIGGMPNQSPNDWFDPRYM